MSPAALRDATPEADYVAELASALNELDQGIALFDPLGVLLAANATWLRWHRDALDTALEPGADMLALLRKSGNDSTNGFASYRAHLRTADGNWLELEWVDSRQVRARFMALEDGKIVGVLEDITDLHRREEDLRESAQRFRSYAETCGDWFWEIDEKLRYRVHTGNAQDVLGEDSELAGEGFLASLRQRAEAAEDVDVIARSMAAREPFRECEVRIRDPQGDERVCSLSGNPFVGADGSFHGYRGTGRNISEAHKLARRLTHQATHDDLTGLANRRALETRITRIIAERDHGTTPYALCFLDVDQIKVINDTCGHGAGDALLSRLAQRLHEGVPGAHTVARLGGDEFALLLRGFRAREALDLAERMRKSIAKRPFTWEGQQFRVTASIGVAPLTSEMHEAGDLLGAADSACYAAKERGRNRVKLYAPDDATLNIRQGEMHWVARIHAALAENRFEVLLQPITHSAEASPGYLHFEALLRMNGRDGRTFPPGAFLPAAERYNLASQIDAWVLDETLAWLDRSPAFLDKLHLLAVNLSGQSLGEPAFLSHVHNRMHRHPKAARKLCFEITETAAISNLDQLQEFMTRMRTLGCSFALDDFGAGLSSFAYLRTLDVDYLKIDGMFVKDVHEDRIHEAMVRSINEVGHVMGKKTIAEFVENDAIRHKLAEIGVDYVQGYAIGEPLPFDEVI